MKEGPGKKSIGGVHSRIIRRDKQGTLQEGGSISSTEMYADDHARGRAAKTADSTFSGTAAPRVGGSAKLITSGAPGGGGSKKQIRASKIRVNKSAASPAAKKSAKRLYR